MTIGAAAGTKLFIGGTASPIPSPDNATWVEVKDIASLGAIGSSFNKIAVESLGSGFTQQIKGTQLHPEFSIRLNRNDADPGQIALLAAVSDRNSLFNFKVEENDLPVGGFRPTTFNFRGRVYSDATTYGGVNDLKRVDPNVEIEPGTLTKTLAF